MQQQPPSRISSTDSSAARHSQDQCAAPANRQHATDAAVVHPAAHRLDAGNLRLREAAVALVALEAKGTLQALTPKQAIQGTMQAMHMRAGDLATAAEGPLRLSHKAPGIRLRQRNTASHAGSAPARRASCPTRGALPTGPRRAHPGSAPPGCRPHWQPPPVGEKGGWAGTQLSAADT